MVQCRINSVEVYWFSRDLNINLLGFEDNCRIENLLYRILPVLSMPMLQYSKCSKNFNLSKALSWLLFHFNDDSRMFNFNQYD